MDSGAHRPSSTRRAARALALLVFLITAAGLSGCGDDGAPAGSEDRLTFRFFSSSNIGLPTTSVPIDAIRVTVVDGDQKAVAQEILTRDAQNLSVLDDLDFAEDLVFLFEALDATDGVLATGGTRPIDVADDGSASKQRYVFMTPLGAISPTSALYSGGQVGPSDFTDGSFRAGHTTVVLADGRVLVIGGASLTDDGAGMDGSNVGELYDTVLVYDMNQNGGYFDASPLRLSAPRAFHSATLLDNGDVLITGGLTSSGQTLSVTPSVDLISVSDEGTLSVSPLGDMGSNRAHHTATHIGDNQVLLAGGQRLPGDDEGHLDSAEIYSATRGGTLLALSLLKPRARHSATVLEADRVLLCGGRDDTAIVPDCELFQGAAAGQFVAIASLPTPRAGHTTITLSDDGQRYTAFIGGFTDASRTTPSNTIEFFDSATGTFDASRATLMVQARGMTSAVPLHQGSDFIVIGGLDASGEALRSIELFRERTPGVGDYQGIEVANLLAPRFLSEANLMPSGMVLITGGAQTPGGQARSLFSNELYNPGIPQFAPPADP